MRLASDWFEIKIEDPNGDAVFRFRKNMRRSMKLMGKLVKYTSMEASNIMEQMEYEDIYDFLVELGDDLVKMNGIEDESGNAMATSKENWLRIIDNSMNYAMALFSGYMGLLDQDVEKMNETMPDDEQVSSGE